ncbi:MAG: ATP-binding cassette domain-containing protein, partial [Clostridia bacterium]
MIRIPLIMCDNVSLAYENVPVVKNLSFSVFQGDYLCVIGENGSGKSTLLKALLGLKSVSAGKISYGDGLLKNEIGYLPQQTEIQRDFPASVFEVVISG